MNEWDRRGKVENLPGVALVIDVTDLMKNNGALAALSNGLMEALSSDTFFFQDDVQVLSQLGFF